MVAYIATDAFAASQAIGLLYSFKDIGHEDVMLGYWLLAANNVIHMISFSEPQIIIKGWDYNFNNVKNTLFIHDLKSLAQMKRAYEFISRNDTKEYTGKRYLNPFIYPRSPSGFPLQLNHTHCVDLTFFHAAVARPCDGSVAQSWTIDHLGHMKSELRNQCLENQLDFKFEGQERFPHGTRVSLQPCIDSRTQRWEMRADGTLRSLLNTEKISLKFMEKHGYVWIDKYYPFALNTGFGIAIADPYDNSQKWYGAKWRQSE